MTHLALGLDRQQGRWLTQLQVGSAAGGQLNIEA